MQTTAVCGVGAVLARALVISIPWPVMVYLVMSLVTLVFYYLDKNRSRRGAWRIPENTLHLLELAGGWPGALVAQRLFRHKYQKGSYMLVFWLIVAVHLLGWCWYLGWIRFW